MDFPGKKALTFIFRRVQRYDQDLNPLPRKKKYNLAECERESIYICEAEEGDGSACSLYEKVFQFSEPKIMPKWVQQRGEKTFRGRAGARGRSFESLSTKSSSSTIHSWKLRLDLSYLWVTQLTWRSTQEKLWLKNINCTHHLYQLFLLLKYSHYVKKPYKDLISKWW